MKDQILIANSRLLGHQQLQQILIRNQTIITIAPDVQPNYNTSVIDVKGDFVSLGGIDLQINGGLGLAFPDLESQDINKLTEIGNFLGQQGIDAYLPTIVTTSVEKIQRSLSVIAEYVTKEALTTPTAKILGVHLEGPFLAYEKRGAHPAKYLLPLSIDKVKQVLGDYTSIVKVITLAPELDPTGETISYLHSQKITVSLGHSLATAQQARAAFRQGASMVTHAFNAMPSLHHRQPGLLGAAIVNPKVLCGLIADGNHVCPEMIDIFLKASNYSQGVFLVSDALAPMGLPDGVYPWDSRTIEVTEGTARLTDGTLAGTTLPLLVGVKNLVQWGICTPEDAIAMATESPRKAIGLSTMLVGQPANLLRWHWDEAQNNLIWERLFLFI
ncbi:MAG: N-acetylglucosamine-6-phosphate deacetylase [Xenococcaceae cyanobacterium MO_167.B27]|nr:N-acetylglucosamine-6-phosphate deacetylase [Xenococcaceae cyanobacterium MO_167.B27]